MRKLFLFILLFLIFISCAPKKQVVAPILLEHTILYPLEARNRGYEGLVLVKVLVDEKGHVHNARVARTSGISMLDSAAVLTAKSFVFSPAIVDGKPIQLWVTVPVEFKLREIRIDLIAWLDEVTALQGEIGKAHEEEKIKDLYNLYKRLINSTRGNLDVMINDYIKEVVIYQTADLWDGFWLEYPGTIILFIDIINRYPDSSVSSEAWQDFKNFFEEEKIRIRNAISPQVADAIIGRLSKVIQD